MDDFGVLTQSMGIKPQGKAAPMAALKQSSRPAYHQPNSMIQSFSDSDGFDDVFGAGYGKASNGSGGASGNSFNYDSVSKSFGGSFYDAGDVFDGMPGFKSAGSPDYDDVFGSFGGSQTAPVDGLFGATAEGSTVSRNGSSGSGKISSAGFDNLISVFGGATAKSNGINLNTSVNQQAKKSTSNQLDDPFIILKTTSGNMYPDLLDQLGRLGTSRSTNLHHSSSSGSLYDNTDPFDIFHNADVRSSSSVGSRESNKANSTRPASSSPPSTSPPPRPTKKAESVKNPTASSIDELEDFAMGRMQHTAAKKSDNIKKKDGSNSAAAAFTATWKGKEGSHFSGSTESPHMSRKKSEDADFLFGMGSHFNKNRVAEDAASLGNHHKSADDLEFNFGTSRSNSAPRARNTNLNTAFDNLFQDSAKHEQARKVTTTTPSSRKKATPNTNLVDDFSSLFGPGLSGDFQDIDGEPEERRKARLGRHYRIQDRVAQAVADMNERDLQSQREQEERQRIADSLDADIKRWAAGKEGNLRALLSSMQYVVWADCGWEPVSLTDLITSSSVKKVYRKATLFVHPDKVQQKGANLQQKYIAEKVFDILKEAYNKFKTNEMS